MDIVTVRKNEQKTAEWSGGVTTQLAIWPEGADYQTRNFKWRISTARVDLYESTFTALPGVSRWLMMLEGEIRLDHESRNSLDMRPFSPVAEFDGGWTTRSTGRCVDFNLMTKAGYTGGLGYIPEGADSVVLFGDCSDEAWEAIYCVADALDIHFGSRAINLAKGDFVLFHAKASRQPKVLGITCSGGKVPAARAWVRRTV